MERQLELVALLNEAVELFDAAVKLEQTITHSKHPNKNYNALLFQLKSVLNEEHALLRRIEIIGR